MKRHCPNNDGCKSGEICFSHLADCNYVEMTGGPPKAAPGGGGGDGGSEPPRTKFCGYDWNDAVENCDQDDHWCSNGADSECPSGKTCFADTECKIGQTLPKNDPSRSNFCGSDWNDAIAHCSSDDHWCPNGADEDCPEGKVCFAGTECKYDTDLFPTVTPTNKPTDLPTTPFPSVSPTLSPVIYNTIEHTRFCGKGWAEVRDTCRMGSHCPSGSDAVCPSGQTCYAWVSGCNIVDFETHYRETGRHIFGSSHWLMPEEGLEGLEDVTIDANDLAGVTKKPLAQLPPAEFLQQYGGKPPGQSPGKGMTVDEWDGVGCPEEYNDSGEYADGSVVSTEEGNVFKCKPYVSLNIGNIISASGMPSQRATAHSCFISLSQFMRQPEEGYCTMHAPDSTFGYLGWVLLSSCTGTCE